MVPEHGKARSGPAPAGQDATDPCALAPLLRELDQQWQQEQIPVGARNRIELKLRDLELQERPTWRRWVPAATFAAGAALVFAMVGLQFPAATPVANPTEDVADALAIAAPPSLGEYAMLGQACRVVDESQDESQNHQAGTPVGDGCRLRSQHSTAEVLGMARVLARGDQLEVVAGQMLFNVDKLRPRDTAVSVQVSHGVIEVVGTRFLVDQGVQGGHVDLFEGKIRFIGDDGVVLDIEPGQRHRWGQEANAVVASAASESPAGPNALPPVAPEVAPEVAAQASTAREGRSVRRRGGKTRRNAAALITRVEELRAQKQYRAAVAELRAALRKRWDKRTSQVLSYELGELLHRYLGERQAACTHLVGHQRRFPGGRYSGAVERTLDKLECNR